MSSSTLRRRVGFMVSRKRSRAARRSLVIHLHVSGAIASFSPPERFATLSLGWRSLSRDLFLQQARHAQWCNGWFVDDVHVLVRIDATLNVNDASGSLVTNNLADSVSVANVCQERWLPRPLTLVCAPTRPAMSTNSTVAGADTTRINNLGPSEALRLVRQRCHVRVDGSKRIVCRPDHLPRVQRGEQWIANVGVTTSESVCASPLVVGGPLLVFTPERTGLRSVVLCVSSRVLLHYPAGCCAAVET